MKLRFMAAAVCALAFTNVAQAAVQIGNTTTPELFLAVFDGRPTGTSGLVSETLIVDLNQSALTFDFNTSTSFAVDLSNFSGVASSDLRFAVFAGQKDDLTLNQLFFTAAVGTDPADLWPNSVFDVDQSINYLSTLVGAHNALPGDPVQTFTGGAGSFKSPSPITNAILPDFNGGSAINTAGAFGTALAFFNVGWTFDGVETIGEFRDLLAGTFTLNQNSLVYSAGSAPIPLPAGVWLLGSALLGLAGVSRRRRLVQA
jgi:hypothetical protein